jgi:hypothetical protein
MATSRQGIEMTNEQTIDEIMKAAADSVLAEIAHHNMPSSLRAGVCERKETALRHAITAALAAKDAEIERPKTQLAKPAEPELGEWIEWAGGQCPIADGVLFSAKFRDGAITNKYRHATEYRWSHGGGDLGVIEADIVAYRVLA